MTDRDYADLDEAERRFSTLTRALRDGEPRPGLRALTSEWVRAKPRLPRRRLPGRGRAARRAAGEERAAVVRGPGDLGRGEKAVDELYERNDREHRAIQAALVARSPEGARAIARDHVLHSFRLLETVLDLAEPEPLPSRRRRRGA